MKSSQAKERLCSFGGSLLPLMSLVLVLSGWSCSAGKVSASKPLREAGSTERKPTLASPGPQAPPGGTNIILLIGDGMGVSQISAGMFASGNRIAMERMPVVGLHKNASSDNLVTDSAAGATAFACGVKTYNGAIGVKPDSAACPTLLEYAAALGMPTGLVATSTIVHATPASFFAHEASRGSYENIARQLASSPVDFFIGGGLNYFSNRESDDRDLVAEMRAAGQVIETFVDAEVVKAKPDPKFKYGFLTSNDDPLPAAQGRDYLPGASQVALDYLKARDASKQGFFLMIEGSQIDWGGHANDGPYIVSEVQDFSRTLDVVLDWAERNPNTLVVVTADHETGGFSIKYNSRPDSLVYGFTSDYHTAALIPVFASGVGAENFGGIYENTAIYDKLFRIMAPKEAIKLER